MVWVEEEIGGGLKGVDKVRRIGKIEASPKSREVKGKPKKET